MAQFSHILIPEGGNVTTATLGAGLATAGLQIAGANKKFTITVVDSTFAAVPFQLAYGDSSISADANSDMFLPGKYTLQRGAWTHLSIYNPNGGTVTYFIAPLANS